MRVEIDCCCIRYLVYLELDSFNNDFKQIDFSCNGTFFNNQLECTYEIFGNLAMFQCMCMLVCVLVCVCMYVCCCLLWVGWFTLSY